MPPTMERTNPARANQVLEFLVRVAQKAREVNRRVRLLAYVELIASLGLAAYAQHIIDDRGTFGAGWWLLSSFDDKLTAIYRTQQSVAYAIPLFFVAGTLFVHSLSQLLTGAKAIERDEEASERYRHRVLNGLRLPIASGLFLLAVGCWSFVIYQLAGGGNQASNWWLFWGAIACAAGGFFLIDSTSKVPVFRTLRWHPFEFAFVGLAIAFFIGLMAQDLTDWQYAQIGDEGFFWEFGKAIAEGDHDYNYFSTRGPFGDHPVMSSVYRGMVMRLGGVSMMSWKLASTISIAATLPLFYWIVRNTVSRRAALFGTSILAVSHVMFAYAHTGYDNVLAIFPAVLAFALYIAGTRTRSAVLLFCSGAAAGFGFYTFYSARTAIMILALAVLFTGLQELRRAGLFRWARGVPLPIAAGFVLVAMPVFAVHGWDAIGGMTQRSVWCCNDFQAGLGITVDSIPRAFLAFNYHTAAQHYVSGSLLDEISAVLAILGLSYALYRITEPGYRFLVIWGLVAIVVTGVLHQHPLTELPTRMNYAIPPMAAFAGLALDRIVLAASSAFRGRRVELLLSVAAFVAVLPAIFGFNAHRFWKETPSVLQLSGNTVIYREATSENCDIEGYRNIVFARYGAYNATQAVFSWYGIEDRSPLILQYEGPLDVYDELISATRVSCLLFNEPDIEVALPAVERYVSMLSQRGSAPVIATDTSGLSKVLVLEWPRD